MNANKFPMLVMFVACFASQLFSENQPSDIQTTFVGKIKGAGSVIDAIQTKDGNYVTLSTTTLSSAIVRKSTATGARVWERSLDFPMIDGYFSFSSIAQTNTGYVIVGDVTPAYYYSPKYAGIISLRPDGSVGWHKIFQVSGGMSFYSVIPNPDDGFTVVGAIYPPAYHPMVIRFTAAGDILWQRGFDNLSSYLASHPTLDNGLVLASQVINDEYQPVRQNLIKVDHSGRIVWGRTLSLRHNSLAVGHTLENGTILATKHAASNTLSLIGLNAAGKLKWKANYQLNVTKFYVTSVTQTSDHGYIVTGTTRFKNGKVRGGFFIKIDAQRNLISQNSFGYAGIPEEAHSVFATTGGGYVLLGSSNWLDVLFLSLNQDAVVPGCNFFHPLNAKKVQSPNVAMESLRITISNPGLSTKATEQLISRASEQQLIATCQ